MPAFQINRLSEHIGAEITGLDLRQTSDAVAHDLKNALAHYLVLIIRDQDLTPEDLHNVARRFGQPVPYPFVSGIPGYPDIVEIRKLPEETVNFGGVWHSDTAYLPQPAKGALLYGLDIPEKGGDTLFSSMYAAYDSLSNGLRHLLASLRAINDADKAAISETRPGQAKKGLKATHPVIRVHPETGRPLLYVNRAHTTHFSGWSENESAGLLTHLFEVAESAEFSCRLQWQPGSLALWDNRACQHYPLNDYHGELRRMLRISLSGETPRA